MRGNGSVSHAARGFLMAAVIMACAPPVARAQAPVRLSIAEALRRADTASEGIGIARAGVRAAGGRVMQARSGWLPQLSGSATYTRTIKSQFEALAGDDTNGEADPAPPPPENCTRFIPDPTQPVDTRLANLERGLDCTANGTGDIDFSQLPFGRPNQWAFGLDLQQTLFDRALLANIRGARAGEAAAEAEFDAARAATLLEVAQAYYDAQLADRLLVIADSTLAQAERIFRETELARRVGNAAEFDLLRVTVARDNQRPVVIQRRTNRDLALVRLRQLLDLPPGTPLELVTPLGDTTAMALPAELPAAGDTAVDARAAVRAAGAGRDIAEAARDAARGTRWPSVRLSSAYSQLTFPEDVFSFGSFLTDWTVSLRVSVPLFTGGRIAGQVREAEALAEQAALRLRQTRELAAREAIEVRDELVAAEARFAASQSTAAQAARAYQIAELRMREGLSTLTDLSDVRLQLEQAEANRAQAARDVQVARLRARLLRDLPLGAGAAVGGMF
jgi:outer membrane protein TolC